MGLELKGGERLQKKLAEIAKQYNAKSTVLAGFLEGATYPDGTPVATIAALNNFGVPSKGIPARPFMTKVIQQKSPEWGTILMRLLKANGGNVENAMAKMGLFIESQIADSIVEFTDPANSMATNLLKQRFPTGVYEFDDVLQAWHDVKKGETAPAGKPLVWSGHMLQSIGSEVI